MKRKTPEQAEFDFAAYLFLLERVLPKRSKARKLIPQLENYVDSLKIAAGRPWENFDPRHGTERDQAATELMESIMKIPHEWRYTVGVTPAIAAVDAGKAPGVEADVKRLLERERNFCYIQPFIMLRLKGEVSLNETCKPVAGTVYDRSTWITSDGAV